MRGKMDEDYFDEKKKLAQEGIQDAKGRLDEVKGLIAATSYNLTNLVNPSKIHEDIAVIKAILDNSRRDFEKARWASAETDISFEEWLAIQGHGDLCLS